MSDQMREWKTQKGTTLYIRDLRGKDYMEVKWRLVWFREEHPTWRIMTEPVSITEKDAMFRAEIRDDHNFVIATGHKYEDKQGFADFREKAETGAIGRALAHVGYGTQFAPEMDEGDNVVDSPNEKRPVVRNAFKDPEIQDQCKVCSAKLTLSKSREWLYCPNWEDKAKGEHTRVSAPQHLKAVK